jgi:hypothetical protein
MTRDQALQSVEASIAEFFRNDVLLLENDVSERAITHKLAQYLEGEIKERHKGVSVDCEYNRNLEHGPNAPKSILLLEQWRENELENRPNLKEDDYRSVTTFPDIIVHHRGDNKRNLLIIEVKKSTNPVGSEFDYQKLRAFTDVTGVNPYKYRHGLFILFRTGVANPPKPTLTWFCKGEEDI